MSTDIRVALTEPGAPFEVIDELVRGRNTQVYRERMRSLREIPARARTRGNDATFIVYGDRRIGFESFVDLSNSASWGLLDLGVGIGDRVAVLAQNCPEWCVTFWGSVDIGAVLVGLNGWWNADEIIHGLNDSGAKVLVADRKRLARVADRLGECRGLDTVVFIDDGAPPPNLPSGSTVLFSTLTASPTSSMPGFPLEEDDPAVILYTSGTTGRAKGSVSTHRNMIASLQNSLFASAYATRAAGEARLPGRPVSLFTSPLFHVSGCHSTLVTGLLAGLKLVMVEGRFTPELALELIAREKVTMWATVPTMVWRVCQHPDVETFDTTSVRSVAFGGSPSADELQRLVRSTFPNVRGASNAYGLTESSSAATVLSPLESVERPGSVGQALPTIRIRIVDAAGHDVAAGVTGEILITGPTITPGYWNNPEATAETIDGDGWLHSGDLGHLDDAGYLFVTDRLKDVIIRGGENVYSVEIEQRLVAHPSVLDAAVFGRAHVELGEEVLAAVQATDPITMGELQTWVGETLATFKVPVHISIGPDPLPRNASGKVLKDQLRGTRKSAFEELM